MWKVAVVVAASLCLAGTARASGPESDAKENARLAGLEFLRAVLE